MNNFINEQKINSLLNTNQDNKESDIDLILEKALLLKGLTLEEAAALLRVEEEILLKKIFNTALKVKELIYGNRLVIFAPFYVSNYCSNNCLYCGFRKDNHKMRRRCLSFEDIKKEILTILRQGHKRILMLAGEAPGNCDFDYFVKAIETAYSLKDEKGSSIRRINVEIEPLGEDDFKRLSEIPIGTYTVFQETYHFDTYKKMHPSGKKSDYYWRLFTMDRALKNGMRDVGIGALFGLYDYRFETLALIEHAKHLDETYGAGPHTISVPRIEPAQNAPASINIPEPVSDIEFKKIVAILRLAVPYTGIILSTRESPRLRHEVFELGVSQISAGSKTNPGGYGEEKSNQNNRQFSLGDNRSTDEIIKGVINQGFVPSFCTACYRLGRVGGDFMDMAKPGLIKMHCLPNALLTLMEYLIDYADSKTRAKGEFLISKELEKIPNKERKEKTVENLKLLKKGKRDLYF